MPKLFNLKVGDEVIVDNYQGTKDDYFVGYKGEIVDLIETGTYDYGVLIYHNGHSARSNFKESELRKLNKYKFTKGQQVTIKNNGETATVQHIDEVNEQIEVHYHEDLAFGVVGMDKVIPGELPKVQVVVDAVSLEPQGKFQKLANEIGAFTDEKNRQYGSSVDATQGMIEVLMERYTYDEEQYLIPKELLQHILLTVRMMDKLNRLYNNPTGEGDSESPYRDLAGYSLIGINMVEKEKVNEKN